MRKRSFEPSVKHECGLDQIIYDHYMERKKHPVQLSDIGPVIRGMDVGKLRYPDEHPTYELIDLAEHIEEKEYDFGGYRVRWYCPCDVEEASPCIFYIHGGGYFMGSVGRLNNINRRLAQLIHGIVVHIDYTLSPEAAYPVAIEQCYAAIKRMVEHSEEYLIDANRVAVMGDSAGGNCALAVALKDRNTHYIKKQFLYYPVVDMTSYSTTHFHMERYGENLHELIVEKIKSLRDASDTMKDYYIQDDSDPAEEYISPLFAKDFSLFPRTVMISAEYDFLRLQCEAFVEKLDEAGVQVDYYLYKGTFHGFLERVGVFEQADHSLHLIADLMKEEW